MPAGDKALTGLVVHPLTPERWEDFERLFGEHGAYGGCWCMWWRLTRREFERGQGEGNRMAMKAIVESGQVPGILAYLAGEPVGWCSVAPRTQFGSLERSRVMKRIDDLPVWSVVCLYVHRAHRGEGVGQALVHGAVEYACGQGAAALEAYPTLPRGRQLAPVSSFMGLPKMFERAGFVQVAQPSASRLIVRCSCG
jgi:GNAT superfamily N-acetyltransferase